MISCTALQRQLALPVTGSASFAKFTLYLKPFVFLYTKFCELLVENDKCSDVLNELC